MVKKGKKSKKKDPIGKQINKKVKKYVQTKDKGPEAREVTKEWGKNHNKHLEEIIKDPQFKHFKKVYIKILAKKTPASENIAHVVYGVSNFPPSPAFKCVLYSYDRIKDQWMLEWILPQAKESACLMLANEDGYDPFLIDCIKKYFAGLLPGQNKVFKKCT